MSAPFQVAALFVMPKGVYVGHDRIDAWTTATPIEFRNLLLSIASSAMWVKA